MNDDIRICPICGESDCDHVERLVASILRSLGTGVINLDLCCGMRWVASLRKHERTAIIELKKNGERMEKGQSMALCDLTGQLWTVSGLKFHQRSFVIWQLPKNDFVLTTFVYRGNEIVKRVPLVNHAPLTKCLAIVSTWMHEGYCEGLHLSEVEKNR